MMAQESEEISLHLLQVNCCDQYILNPGQLGQEFAGVLITAFRLTDVKELKRL